MAPRQRILSFIRFGFNSLRKTHVTNLALFCWGLWRTKSVCLAHIARACSITTTPRHTIKRLNRFLGNPRLDDHQAQALLLRQIIGPRQMVLIALDWTKIRHDSVLVAAVVHKGRALPVMWEVARAGQVKRSFNNYEDALLLRLAEALPDHTQAVVLADRGFKRVNLLHHLHRLRALGISYIIRMGGNVGVDHPDYHGPVNKLIRCRSHRADLYDALLRPSEPVRTRLVGAWYRRQKEPWLLVTDLDWPPRRLMRTYGRRFHIEETFRDIKCTRYGLAMKQLKMRKTSHLNRLLLVVSCFYWIALIIGVTARKRRRHKQFQANTLKGRRNHSDFMLGAYYLEFLQGTRKRLLRYFFKDAPQIKTGDS